MADTSRLRPALRGELRRDEPMARHVSWRAGGRARTFYRPGDVPDLCAFLAALPAGEPVLFVGLGSNLLVRDGGFPGTVLFTHHALSGLVEEAPPAGKAVMVRAGAGVPMPHVARFVARRCGGGAEWMCGVPGTLGGALAMNAGCYGGETWDHVHDVTLVDRTGALHVRTGAEFEIGYRHVAPRLGREEWFVGARLAFGPGDERASMARMRELLARRVATQPLGLPNAGSVFRNPEGDHAARLIESCGLKGFTVGGAQVSTKHSNFIVNLAGTATAADIEAVIDQVEAAVRERTGISLVREVRIVGEPAHG